MYEKVSKNINCYGINLAESNNILINNPCIITILAIPDQLKNINGFMNLVKDCINSDYKNVKVFGLGFGVYDENTSYFSKMVPSNNEIDEFINKYFSPLLSNNDTKISVINAMKNFRNINFVTYCNAAKTYCYIENRLIKKMKEIGYIDNEINMILSQVCLANISGNIMQLNDTLSLAFTFGDINDFYFDEDYLKIKSIKNEGFIKYSSSIGYGIYGDGNHSLKRHLSEDLKLSLLIKKFLNASLENAFYNKENNNFDPLTYEKMDKCLNFDENNFRKIK